MNYDNISFFNTNALHTNFEHNCVCLYLKKNLLIGFPSLGLMKIIQSKDGFKDNRCAHLSVYFSPQILTTHNNIHIYM